MSNYFEGWYYKHQLGGRTLALIPGRSDDGAFIQVITNEGSWNVPYPLSEYKKGDALRVGNNLFGPDGVSVDINTDALKLSGKLVYKNLSPMPHDIMGPFRFFPMECRHTVVSMYHDVSGSLSLNGTVWDLTGGRGYIEGDSGRSFPQSYAWIQCSDFGEKCSIMASVAKIPFAGLKFWGLLCAVWLDGTVHLLATYKGARILRRERNRLEFCQGRYRLLIETDDKTSHGLYAPEKGLMKRVIRESPSCRARFCFFDKEKLVFEDTSDHASYEYVD